MSSMCRSLPARLLGLCCLMLSAPLAYGDAEAEDSTAPRAPSRMDLLDDERSMKIGDRLVYQVIEEREAPVALFVDDQGEVDIPLAGRFAVLEQTPKEVAFAIKETLEDTFFFQATVLLEFQFSADSRGTINLVGHIARPGSQILPLDDVLTASEAILRAGGSLPGADFSAIELVRLEGPDGLETRTTVDLTAVFERGDMRADIPLQPDDVLVIPQAAALSGTFYITGEVGSPGVYNVINNGEAMTLSEAILRAGGFNRFANQKRVQVIRGDTSLPDEERNLTINVEAILEDGARENDIRMQPDDIVRINELPFAWR